MVFILFYIGFYCILVVLLLVRVCCCCCCCARTSLSVLLFSYCNPARYCLCQFVVAAATITIVPCRGINYSLLGNPSLFLYHAPYRFDLYAVRVVLFERVCCSNVCGAVAAAAAAADTIVPYRVRY